MDTTLILGLLAAFLLGASKAGLKGLGTVVVAILALAYEGKASTGILLPMLVISDILAVIHYRNNIKWEYLKKFLPSAFVGVIIAVFVGKHLPENYFLLSMAIIISLSLFIIIYREKVGSSSLSNNWPFAGSMGIITGFATMLANLAGAFSNIFFLSLKIDKKSMIGTIAIFFFITNLFKVPFHIWSWETISIDTFMLNLKLSPAIFVGFFIGLKIVSYFSEAFYRKFLIVVTAIGALMIFVRLYLA